MNKTYTCPPKNVCQKPLISPLSKEPPLLTMKKKNFSQSISYYIPFNWKFYALSESHKKHSLKINISISTFQHIFSPWNCYFESICHLPLPSMYAGTLFLFVCVCVCYTSFLIDSLFISPIWCMILLCLTYDFSIHKTSKEYCLFMSILCIRCWVNELVTKIYLQ